MKKLALLAVAAFGIFGLSAGRVQASSATTNGLITTFKITALVSPTNSPSIKTNSNGTVITATYTTTKVKVTTQDVLTILGHEFNTTFPDGAQLAYDLNFQGFAVLDKNGNFLLNVSSNLVDTNYVFALTTLTNSTEQMAITGKEVENNSTATDTETVTEYLSNQAIYYQDGNGNYFSISGLETVKADVITSVPEIKSASIGLSGQGGGTFYDSGDDSLDTGVFESADVIAKGKNLPGD